ncbi:MAG TPA: 5-(carboxyamino)imidazole ribonucleotide synthase, partial [Rhodospirillaceae bacterium]|nr:5-(carboxyamino)imidazole ribonucleotide synthase [Rhodospirillaceae bacterium]
MTRLSSGATIGILGNGQLGRMLCLAAAPLGFCTHVYGPNKNSPAEQVATTSTVANYDDKTALATFAKSVDVVTFEFENVPASTAAYLAAHTKVHPSWKALEIAQDRTKEKVFFSKIKAKTADWRPVNSKDDLKVALKEIGFPAILKTSRLGYDGKGQVKIKSAVDAEMAWQKLSAGKSIRSKGAFAALESFIDFSCEISIIAARDEKGTIMCFEPAKNVHENHMLATSTVPANLDPKIIEESESITKRAIQSLDIVGLLAVEMFVTRSGEILCNEMAPRPHNSGHWTIDACGTDQFQQLVRAITGLPLVHPARHS